MNLHLWLELSNDSFLIRNNVNGQDDKLVEVHEVIIKISIKGFCTHEIIHRHHVGFHSTNGQKFHHCPNDPSWSSMAMTLMPIMVSTPDSHHGQDLNDHHSVTPDYWFYPYLQDEGRVRREARMEPLTGISITNNFEVIFIFAMNSIIFEYKKN